MDIQLLHPLDHSWVRTGTPCVWLDGRLKYYVSEERKYCLPRFISGLLVLFVDDVPENRRGISSYFWPDPFSTCLSLCRMSVCRNPGHRVKRNLVNPTFSLTLVDPGLGLGVTRHQMDSSVESLPGMYVCVVTVGNHKGVSSLFRWKGRRTRFRFVESPGTSFLSLPYFPVSHTNSCYWSFIKSEDEVSPELDMAVCSVFLGVEPKPDWSLPLFFTGVCRSVLCYKRGRPFSTGNRVRGLNAVGPLSRFLHWKYKDVVVY